MNILKNFYLIYAIFICFLVFSYPNQVSAQDSIPLSKDGVDYQEGSCSNLSLYMTECAQFKCAMPHPALPNKVIRQEILGFDEYGKCLHKQYMPEGEVITCEYTEDARKYIAMRMEQKKNDPVGNPDREYLERMLLQDIFANECFLEGDEEAEQIDEEDNANKESQ